MKKKPQQPYVVDTLDELHRLFDIPKPACALVSVINLKDRRCIAPQTSNNLIFNFYSVWIKNDPTGKLGYGQHFFDFEKGKMTFQAPGQVISVQDHHFSSGWGLLIHPDFLFGSPLAKKIRGFAFFSYAVYEGLQLSAEEEDTITALLKSIDRECKNGINRFGQEVVLATIELLLVSINRIFYKQFPVIRSIQNDLLAKTEALLNDYFNAEANTLNGLPTVEYLASKLFMSPHYFSDTLRKLTGQNGQQHIHRKLLEFTKDLMSSTNLTVAEVAMRSGFGHLASFSKFFKNQTGVSPLQFRKRFAAFNYGDVQRSAS